MKSYTPEEALDRARAAGALYEHEILREVLQGAEYELTQDSLHALTVEEREIARAGVRALGVVDRRLRAIMDDGAVAKAALARGQ